MNETNDTKRKRGRIAAVLPNSMYSLHLDDGTTVVAHLSPEMRLHTVRLLTGDSVCVELAPFDPTRGRIVKRLALFGSAARDDPNRGSGL